MHYGRIAVLATLSLAACFPKSAVPPGPFSPEQIAVAQQRLPAVTADSLEQGRKLFIDKCGNCHNHPDINAIPVDRWPPILGRMVSRAKMYSSGESMLQEFITAAHQ